MIFIVSKGNKPTPAWVSGVHPDSVQVAWSWVEGSGLKVQGVLDGTARRYIEGDRLMDSTPESELGDR